jgi:ketosteroid isomerase-like protein
MAEHPHIALFRQAHEAFERGDTEAMRSWFADDFVWHEPRHNVLTGDCEGADTASTRMAASPSGGDTSRIRPPSTTCSPDPTP